MQAIRACHEASVIHRDIKPENLLINLKTKTLKLCDFGFARYAFVVLALFAYPRRRVLNRPGEELTDYVATRWYRAPELLLGSTAYTLGVDMWAIGCIMGEISDGQPMFPGKRCALALCSCPHFILITGDSEVDQLYIIQKVLGPLTSDHQELFMSNPRFAGLRFSDMSRPETLHRKYVGKLTRRALSIMKDLLSMEPLDRPSSKDCLGHAYFEGMGQPQPQQQQQQVQQTQQMQQQAQQKEQQQPHWPAIVAPTPRDLPSISGTGTAMAAAYAGNGTTSESKDNDGPPLYDGPSQPEGMPSSRNRSRRGMVPAGQGPATTGPAPVQAPTPIAEKGPGPLQGPSTTSLDKEVERERERIREREIRAFREFSTTITRKNNSNSRNTNNRGNRGSFEVEQAAAQEKAGVHLGPLEPIIAPSNGPSLAPIDMHRRTPRAQLVMPPLEQPNLSHGMMGIGMGGGMSGGISGGMGMGMGNGMANAMNGPRGAPTQRPLQPTYTQQHQQHAQHQQHSQQHQQHQQPAPLQPSPLGNLYPPPLRTPQGLLDQSPRQVSRGAAAYPHPYALAPSSRAFSRGPEELPTYNYNVPHYPTPAGVQVSFPYLPCCCACADRHLDRDKGRAW